MVGVLAHFIAGQRVAGASGHFADVINPATGTAETRVPLASAPEVQAAVNDAAAAQPAWSGTSPRSRARVLFKFLALVEHETHSLAIMLTRERGMTIDDAQQEVRHCIDVVESATGIPHLLLAADAVPSATNTMGRRSPTPLGVVGAATSYDQSASATLAMAVTALVCGHTVVLKPSRRAPTAPMWLAEMFIEAGLPAGVLNLVNGDRRTVEAILLDPRITAMGFAGSTSTADAVASAAAALGTPARCISTSRRRGVSLTSADQVVADWVRFYSTNRSATRARPALTRCRHDDHRSPTP